MVLVYRIDLKHGRLVPHRWPYTRVKPAAGPRHLDYHPNGRWVYLINELTSAVTFLDWNADLGTLAEVCHVPSLPEDFEGANTAADIHVSPDGRFVYATNRGQNAVAMFAIDQSSGVPKLQGYEPTLGDHPRNFCIDPTGKWMFVANMNTNSIVSFAINGQTGALEATGSQLEVPGPSCIKFLNA
jgi:6-phosphogluconolactonase